jgi:phospholipid transport system substrate-binding protein
MHLKNCWISNWKAAINPEVIMKHFKIALIIFITAFVFLPLSNVSASPAKDQLKVTIDKMLGILRDTSLKGDDNKEKRRLLLHEVIHERFSFAKMSQLSLARHWKKRSAEEKELFIDVFGRLLEDTYVTKIETYTDEKIIYVKELVKKKKAQINTKVVTDSVKIPIDYRMYQATKDSWMVYDIVIEGVSLVGNYRSQFDQVLQKESYEKLVEDIRKKVEK